MIKAENISISYSKKLVLDNISIDFLPCHIHGIVGMNGSGKTTFFNTFSTVIKPDRGQIRFNAMPIRYQDVAYVETTNYFYSGITGREYLNIFRQTNPEFNLNVLQDYLKLPLDNLIETYSSGMKKKLALLGVLKQNKPIFLLDEPFNGLDMESNKILEIIITALKAKGRTIFVSSHIIDPLLAICDFIYVLEHGQFVRIYEKSEFGKIEDELFRKLKEEAQQIINNSI